MLENHMSEGCIVTLSVDNNKEGVRKYATIQIERTGGLTSKYVFDACVEAAEKEFKSKNFVIKNIWMFDF